MAAPIVGFLVAALTGAALPSAATHAVFGAVGGSILAVDSAADAAYADLPAICAATDAPLDRLSDLADKGGASGAPLRRLAEFDRARRRRGVRRGQGAQHPRRSPARRRGGDRRHRQGQRRRAGRRRRSTRARSREMRT